MKIAHLSDLHYCPKHLKWVDRAMEAAVTGAISKECELAVISGDSFDHALGLHEPAVAAYLGQVVRLATRMPVVDLYGTPSHDRPGILEVLREMPTAWPILVADKPGAWILGDPGAYTWTEYTSPSDLDGDSECLVCVLPSVNKADPVGFDLPKIFEQFAMACAAAREAGVPSLLVTHGEILGSITESRHAMVSPDHEFTVEMLFAPGAGAVMIGHIHAHQSWEIKDRGMRRTIAYPGSLARLVHGDHAPKGWLAWDVEPGHAEFEFVESPTRQLFEIEFDGPPDMSDLEELAKEAGEDDAVRIRWHVDTEHAHIIDRKTMNALFAHCDTCKLEGQTLPIQSVRAQGIGRAASLHDKLEYWAKTTGDVDKVSRLAGLIDMLRSSSEEEIIKSVVEKI